MKKQDLFLCFSLFALLSLAFSLFITSKAEQSENLSQSGCPIKLSFLQVRGNSMAPIIKNGQSVKLLTDYYACRDVERGDVVAYAYAENKDALIKRVLVLGGDSLEFEKNMLKVNGDILRNSNGAAYLFNSQNKKMISLYIENGRMRADTFFIFGESRNESMDSRKFGAIAKKDLIGKFEF